MPHPTSDFETNYRQPLQAKPDTQSNGLANSNMQRTLDAKKLGKLLTMVEKPGQ